MTRHGVSERDIGVAIGIPEPFRTELQEWRERLGDPNASLVIPHVTLLAPTVFPAADLGVVERHLERVALAGRSFRIDLRGSGSFRPLSPVVFVTLVQGISCCEQLAEQVRSGPLERPLRFPYHPHVTVAHDIDDPGLDRACEALADYRAAFTVHGFSLFERGQDRAWRVLRDFLFVDAPAALPAPHSRSRDR